MGVGGQQDARNTKVGAIINGDKEQQIERVCALLCSNIFNEDNVLLCPTYSRWTGAIVAIGIDCAT